MNLEYLPLQFALGMVHSGMMKRLKIFFDGMTYLEIVLVRLLVFVGFLYGIWAFLHNHVH